MSEPAQGLSPMDELCQHLASLAQAVKDLQQGYTQLEGRLQTLTGAATPQGPPLASASSQGSSPAPAMVMLPPEPRVPTPDRFLGERSKFRAFRNACELYFALQPHTFSLEATKVGFVISLLQGEPQSWAHRLLEQKAECLSNLTSFFSAMAQLYEDPQQTASAEAALYALQQGRRAVEDYVSEFRRWAFDTNLSNAALRYQFHMGLSEPLKDELARVGVPPTLETLIDLSIQIDRRLREQRLERASTPSRPVWMLPRVPSSSYPAPPAPATPAPDTPEPMQLGLLRPSLTVEERQRRRQQNLCLYCGGSGHYVRSCPVKPRKSLFTTSASLTPSSLNNSAHFTIPISLQLPGRTLQTTAIIDSGACSCFVDLSFAAEHHIPLQPKAQKLSVHLADGTTIKSEAVTHETIPLLTIMSQDHRELLRLDAIASPLFPVILSIPWLKAHDPHIDWSKGSINFVSSYCTQHCLQTSCDVPALYTECILTTPQKHFLLV